MLCLPLFVINLNFGCGVKSDKCMTSTNTVPLESEYL